MITLPIMKNRKYISMVLSMVIWSCSGFLLQNLSSTDPSTHQGPPQVPLETQEENPSLPSIDHLRSRRDPSQEVLDTRKGKFAPPLMHVNGHSDIHKAFQAKENDLETETSSYVKSYDELADNKLYTDGVDDGGDDEGDDGGGDEGDDGGNDGRDDEGYDGRIGDDLLQGVLPKSLWFSLHTQMINDDPDKFQRSSDVWTEIPNAIGGFYLPSTNPEIVNNTQCIKDVKAFIKSTFKQPNEVKMMIDSWGKIPDGFLAGNTLVLGSFEECMKAEVHYRRDKGYFQGKYCLISFYDSSVTKEGLQMPNMVPTSAGFKSVSPFVSYATCMPSSCTDNDLRVSLNEKLNNPNETYLMSHVSCQTRAKPSLDYNAGTIVMIVVFALEGSLLLVAAVIDIWIQYSKKEELRKGPLKYLLVFSLYTNVGKIFHINTSESKEAITCLYGMRVLSMTWVVWGHQYLMTLFVNSNKLMIKDVLDGHWMNQVIVNAFLSVDSFFFMSGLLVAYMVFREIGRSDRFNIGLFYFHRFIRLSIPIMLASGFMATFPKLIVEGPLAHMVDTPKSLMDNCRKYWWKDAFFITNYFFEASNQESCLAVCWYTAVDFQLFLVTPIILLPFIYRQLFCLRSQEHSNARKAGVIWLSIMTFASVLIPGILTGIYKLPPTGLMGVTDADLSNEFNQLIYVKPWCRASPYLVGIWLGYLLRLERKKKFSLQMWQVLTGWAVAIGTGLAVVYGMYNYNQFSDYPGYHWAASIFYASLHRLAWGLALAWIVFACHYGYGGPVNTFLSHPSWQPLSRLTYCMFLIAIPIQTMVFVYDNQTPLYWSHLNKIIETVGVLFISGLGAIILSLYTEAPVLGLEKLLLRKEKPTNKEANTLILVNK